VAFGDPASIGEEQFDEETLKSVAAKTDGRYFYAADRDVLEAIYAELDRIETRKVDTTSYRPRRDLYYWPLALALVVSIGYHFIMAVRQRGRTRKPVFSEPFIGTVNTMKTVNKNPQSMRKNESAAQVFLRAPLSLMVDGP